ncbi:hypothetical protein VCR6J2_350074 [Vibrio coralliirubri]|nr:hypothetical protein VCR6J2_350074 [Vibrio coralliirubri]
MAKCNVGKQEQKQDSLSRSFLTVGNDVVGLWILYSCFWQGGIE